MIAPLGAHSGSATFFTTSGFLVASNTAALMVSFLLGYVIPQPQRGCLDQTFRSVTVFDIAPDWRWRQTQRLRKEFAAVNSLLRRATFSSAAKGSSCPTYHNSLATIFSNSAGLDASISTGCKSTPAWSCAPRRSTAPSIPTI